MYDQVKTGSSESQAEAEELNQSQAWEVYCDWFILQLLLLTPTIWFSLDHTRNISDGVESRVRRKWKRSDSSGSNSVACTNDFDYDSDF